MLEKRWKVKTANKEVVEELVKSLKINPVLCEILAVRGIYNYESALNFFRPQLEQLHSPFLMKGMKESVDRIIQGFTAGERILVYGDYDVDGTTAVALVYSFLKKHYKREVNFYIPHRYREGYGVSMQGIEYAHENGYSLIITLDCGIKSVTQVSKAKQYGIDVIVCDHHLPDTQIPEAFAILNPKQEDCTYPYKELSGCGIGFKLISALATILKLDFEQYVYKYLDLVVTSIAADIVPIDGENRILAFFGIKRLNESPCLSIATLKELGGVRKPLTVSDLVFVIGPRVNAAGRMDDARKAVEFFVETEPAKISALASNLHSDNSDRKEVDKSITKEALEMIQTDETLLHRNSTVLYQPHWHKGVVGIVASRLIDHYYRPTIVLTSANGKATGSARSVSGFNIYEAIHECREILDNYGGHFYAAGLTLCEDRVDEFIQKFEAIVSRTITDEQKIPEIEIDAELPLNLINNKIYSIIKQFEPFGPSNMRPVFITRGLFDYQGGSNIVKDLHLKIVAHQNNGVIVEGIGFNLADKYEIVRNGKFDMVYNIEENEYNGNTKLQLKLIDVRQSLC